MRRTERGFVIYAEFKDLDGANVRIQESSLATGRAVWIQNEIVLCAVHGVSATGAATSYAHLSKAMAKRIVKALQRFIAQ